MTGALPPGDAAATLEDTLVAWAGEVLGAPVVRRIGVAEGNRRRGLILETAERRAFLRFATAPARVSADVYSLAREAAVYRGLDRRGLAIPGFLGAHPEHEALLVACIAGDAAFHALGDAQKQQVMREFAGALAALHAEPLAPDALAPLARPATQAEALGAELATWRAMYEETGRDEALIAFALGWLERHAPPGEAPPVFVHGDAGAGNFLIENGRLAALIDWELSHFGDPMEDLAWASFRDAIQPVPDFARFLADYARASGRPLDRARIRYHRVFVATRICIVRHRDHGAFAADSDPANSLISLMLNRAAALAEIAAAMGEALADPPPLAPEPVASPVDAGRMAAFAEGSLKRTVAPALSDRAAKAATLSTLRIVRYLRDAQALGPAAARADARDREALLGSDADEAALVASIVAKSQPDAALVNLLWRRVARERQIAAAAIGVIATRLYPPLPAQGSFA